MPPKARYTRADIAAAAFAIVKKDGVSALTARELAVSLHTSVSPIFTAFSSMDEVKLAARELALAEFREYISDYRSYTPAFKRIGMMIVSYGIHEPELFKLLFMQEHTEALGFENTLQDLGDTADICRELLSHDYGFTPEESAFLFEQLWIQAFGLGAMCAMRVCTFSEEEIGRRLGTIFTGLTMLLKSDHAVPIYGDVEQNTDSTYHGNSLAQFPFLNSAKQ